MEKYYYLFIYIPVFLVGCLIVYWLIKETTEKKTYYQYDEIKQKYINIIRLNNIDDFDIMHQYIESNPNLTVQQANELREILGSKIAFNTPYKKLDNYDTINN